MTAPISRREPARCPFDDTEPVFAGTDDGPRFGDLVWDLRPVIVRASQAEKTLTLERIVGSYQQVARELLMVLAQPTHPAVVAAGIVRRARPAASTKLIDITSHMAVLSQWAHSRHLDALSDWTQEDAHAFLRALETGQATKTGQPLAAGTVRQYVTLLKWLREYAAIFSGGGLGFLPWGPVPAARVARYRAGVANETPPMPWAMWAPLVAGAWKVVNEFSDDIIAAWAAFQALAPVATGAAGDKGLAVLRRWAEAGNKVPLHTGYGRDGHDRGGANRSLLCKMAGLSASLIIRQAHPSFRQAAVDYVDDCATDPERSAFGGLYRPTAPVTQPDGTTTLWVDEIGSGEATYFYGMLRGACYVVLAALTGMRDSEIHELRRGAITESDGLPAIKSTQIKGVASEIGVDRVWWAPNPVIRTIEVLERLSPHPTHLFARAADNAGTYVYDRDVARLLDFINADPSYRIGRGAGLGLQRVDTSSRTPINQQTLRRSFAILAAQYPGAEIGLGIQLGHAALRMTSPYMNDSQQVVTQLFDEERKTLARTEARAVVTGTGGVSGKRAGEILTLRAQVVLDPSRADSIADALGENYHLGTFNDCMFAADRAGCGPEGPHLASHHCATTACANAMFFERHRPTLQAQIDQIDAWLARGIGHPALVEQYRDRRAELAALLRNLDDTSTAPAKD
ncbi:hypothetical protein [Georgenia ruanii]|uniref:hypothetical protein n=1 Tax=Georgenia ruanii TaxID=348442 RepID=UPI00126488CF|nr:hypothetical protein [Georgenia ruanii]